LAIETNIVRGVYFSHEFVVKIDISPIINVADLDIVDGNFALRGHMRENPTRNKEDGVSLLISGNVTDNGIVDVDVVAIDIHPIHVSCLHPIKAMVALSKKIALLFLKKPTLTSWL